MSIVMEQLNDIYSSLKKVSPSEKEIEEYSARCNRMFRMEGPDNERGVLLISALSDLAKVPFKEGVVDLMLTDGIEDKTIINRISKLIDID